MRDNDGLLLFWLAALLVAGLVYASTAQAHRGNVAYGTHDTGENTGHYVDGYYATGKHLDRVAWDTSCDIGGGGDCYWYQQQVIEQGWQYRIGFTWLFPTVRHCPDFQTLQNGQCAESTFCQLPDYSYIADTAPAWGNSDDCLWELASQSANQDGTINVVYSATGWAWADHTGFINQHSVNEGDPVGDLPPASAGTPDPFGGGGGAGDPVSCQIGTEVFVSWAYNDAADPDRNIHCTANGCEAINWAHQGDMGGAVTGICIGDGTGPDDVCAVEAVYTGETCERGTNPEADTDADNSENNGTTVNVDNTGVESRLDDIGNQLDEGLCLPNEFGQLPTNCVADIPAIDDTGVPTIGEGITEFYDRIKAAPVVTQIASIDTSFPPGTCPTASTDPLPFLDGLVLTLESHCEIWDNVIGPIVHVFMQIVWTLVGVGIFMRA